MARRTEVSQNQQHPASARRKGSLRCIHKARDHQHPPRRTYPVTFLRCSLSKVCNDIPAQTRPNHRSCLVRHLCPSDRISMILGSPDAPSRPFARWYGRPLLVSAGMLNRFTCRTTNASSKRTLCRSVRELNFSFSDRKVNSRRLPYGVKGRCGASIAPGIISIRPEEHIL